VPISGLVVVLDAPNGPFLGTLQALRGHAAIDVGEITDNHIAIVVDSTSNQHDQEIWQWVQELPGVLDIRIAFVGFDEATSEEQ
jgi:nitrate reductase NapAB chaperone NapD